MNERVALVTGGTRGTGADPGRQGERLPDWVVGSPGRGCCVPASLFPAVMSVDDDYPDASAVNRPMPGMRLAAKRGE
jgi:hypothetical protein